MNQWAVNGDKQVEERYGQFWELSGQGKQHCFKLFVVCLKDAEDRWTREDCSIPGMKEHRQVQEFNIGHNNSSLCTLVGAVALCCMSFLGWSWLYTSS